MRRTKTSVSDRRFGCVACAVALIGLGGCGVGTISGDDDKGCTAHDCGAEACAPIWECEQPLDGYEKDGCENRRRNPACDAPSLCGNGVTDLGEACESQGNLGCNGSTPVCKPDCSECTRAIEECTKARCTDLGKNCGEVMVDGCGVIRCGDCEAPKTCGGGGTPNVCAVEDCEPNWDCEQPLNGNEKDGCGNRRPNPACDAPSQCGNGVKDAGEACDWQGDVGCNDPTPVCQKDCRGCNERSGTLLWDGSFHGNEHRESKNNLVSDGQYMTYTCLAQPDSFTVVPAPGGRPGFAGKFYDGVGESYECNSNRHNMIGGNVPPHPGPTGIRDVWYGWSQYLERPWSPSGGTVGTGSIGMGFTIHGFSVSGRGIGIANFPNSWVMQINAAGTEFFNLNKEKEDWAGAWYDFLWHVKWARDNSGFLELWLRKPGQSDYSKVYSKTNFVTEYPQPGIAPEKATLEVRLGQYGDLSATNPQTIYILNPKMGTTRADVEYKE